ncbi:transglycosylase SLT domain-containing protein [Alicyclobacillus tolerans]|uniref:transglycosylase SLT domain-containing protein n=1 Tax=Alicyclobacillus tolerans TaxID=90970 RepID=UPI001F1BF8DE|nr:transglycosylase SLT domain-containing protein [Alicyclobacillus tolerans]MCF8567039.1 transglycosylase SLT domain-containing protein [Alicyclobacillus tolerans]
MTRTGERSRQVLQHLAAKMARQAAWKLVLWGIGLVVSLGGPALLAFVLIAVIVNVSGSFFLGSFSGVHLSGTQAHWAKVNQQIQQEYTTTANQWANGLNAKQQAIVRSYQLNLPASVLLTMGKFIDNYTKPNETGRAQDYYNLVKPKYTWVKGQGETIHKYWTTVQTKYGPEQVIATQITYFTVWELRKAVVWNGGFTSTWGTKILGGFPGGVGTETIEPWMTGENMVYDHRRFYAAAKQYGFQKTDVDPLWFDAIYSMQWAQYKAGDEFAYLLDPKVMQWGPIFGSPAVLSTPTPGSGHVAKPAQVKQWIQQALQIDAVYGIPSSWAPYIFTIISDESGGNPLEVNPQAVYYAPGLYEHAQGIMQTMPSTFQEFAVPGHMNIWNPVDNISAALRYLQEKYHTPLSINGIGNNLPYQGY